MKSILFVHIKDPTTDFLEAIYKDRRDCTIVRNNLPVDVMNSLIRNHDQVVMMGHGSPAGLFGNHMRHIINEQHVDALAEKDNNVYIWCHANAFVKEHNLKGFSTSMFISEHSEATWVLKETFYPERDEKSIEASNALFASLVANNLDEPIATLAKNVRYHYAAHSHPGIKNQHVVDYNRNGLIFIK